MRVFRLLILFACMFFVTPALAGIGDDDWYEVRSDNFQIFTNGNAEEVKALVREMEFFRGVVIAMTGSANINNKIPFRIFAASNRSDFKQFFSQFNVVGVFTPSVRGHYAAIDLSAKTFDRSGRPVRGADVYLKHEYVHYILRGGSRVRYPYWYEEGFAEYLSTLEYDKGEVRVGYPVIGRHISLNQEFGIAGVEALLTSTRLERTLNTDVLYAQGWLLVHYLHTQPELAPRIADYLKRYDQTGDSVGAFNEVFKLDLGNLKRELTSIAERGRYNYGTLQLKQPLPEPNVTVRKLPPDESLLRLAEVLSHFRGDKRDFAEVIDFYRNILAHDPGNREAVAGLATLSLQIADVQGAAALLSSLPETADEVSVLIARGKLAFASAMAGAPSRAAASAERIAQARELYLAALKQDPNSAEAFFHYGVTFLGSSEDSRDGLIAFREAYNLVPSDTWVGSNYALMQLQAGEFEQAAALAERLALLTSDKKQAARCRKIAEFAAGRAGESGRVLANDEVNRMLSGKSEGEEG